MSDLTAMERIKIERLFGMDSGYVLDFSNRTFSEFVLETTRRDIYDSRYEYGSGSKANRLRAFWKAESNHLAAKLIEALIEYEATRDSKTEGTLPAECRQIVARLRLSGTAVAEIEALASEIDERDFDTIARQARDAVEKNQPEAGLDRLHTFLTKFVRGVCHAHGIAAPREKPLHSLFGERLGYPGLGAA
jgi:hypothetical protein